MMDVEFLAYILLAALLISLQVLLHAYRSSLSVDPNLPPGTMGWPVIGETLEFLSAGWRGRPERFVVDRMKRFSASTVFKTCILGEPMAVFCSPQGFKFLFSNESKVVVPWWPAAVNKIFPSAQNSGPAGSVKEAKKMRRLLPNFLKPDALKGYVEIMDKTAKMHFGDCWENKEEVLAFSLAKKYTFVIASRLFLSVDDPSCMTGLTHQFHLLTSGIISFPLDFPGTPFNRAVKAGRFIRKELSVTIKKRRGELAEGKASPTQDIMSYMLATPIPSTPISTGQQQISNNNDNVHSLPPSPPPPPQFMTDLEIADKIMGLLIGGHDTTTVVITFIVKYLAELPDIYDQVYKEQMEIARFKLPGELLKWDDLQKMKYSWNVACEVLRLHPPLQGAFREAIHSFTYEGCHIPKGWKIYMSMQSTHRNPKYFPDPERFDPTRFEGSGPAPYAFLPFGGGPRMCPGQEYARLVILVFMHNLVTRFKWENLVQDEKIIVNPTPEPTKGLPVRLYPHNKRQCSS